MTNPAISVIISVYEQAASLSLLLSSLAIQDCPEPFEVIVCDDGSTPAVLEVCKTAARSFGLDLRYIWQPDAGYRVARSRNNAIRCARGDLLVFLDGDIVVKPDLLRAHLKSHEAPARIVCNRRSWVSFEPDALAEGGSAATVNIASLLKRFQDSAQDVDRRDQLRWWRSSLPWMACVGFSVSVARGPFVWFDENFAGWGPEDREFACRLANRHGHEVSYRDDIEVFHLESVSGVRPAFHPFPVDHDAIIQYLKGLLYFHSLYPELDLIPALKPILLYRMDPVSNRWSLLSPVEAGVRFGELTLGADTRRRIEITRKCVESWLKAHNQWIERPIPRAARAQVHR